MLAQRHRSLPVGRLLWRFNHAGSGVAVLPSRHSPLLYRPLSNGPLRKHQGPAAVPQTSLPDIVAGYPSKMIVAPQHGVEVRQTEAEDYLAEHAGIPSTTTTSPTAPPAPLSVLPLSAVLRSLMISSVSSSKLLLPPALAVMSLLATAKGGLLNPDRNPLLRWVVKKTFYAQFCAGETRDEVMASVADLKKQGFSGVILGYAKEIELLKQPSKGDDGAAACEIRVAQEQEKKEIGPWLEGTIETVNLSQPGDFVAVKLTGAGRQAMTSLAERKPPPPVLANAIDAICSLAVSRGVRLLIDAEHAAIQPGIDDWTLDCMRKYNTTGTGATVFGTYQAYLKSCASTVASHLQMARAEGFVLGVKLVRGAYLESDPRHLIHDTKEDTDAAYDGIAEGILTRTWNDVLRGEGIVPEAGIVLATHNADSVRLGRELVEKGMACTADVSFAQLQGMADEISCELVAPKVAEQQQQQQQQQLQQHHQKKQSDKLNAYKYVVWGSTGECMKYLLRRAYENRDAVGRTRDGRDAMFREVVRRVKASVLGA